MKLAIERRKVIELTDEMRAMRAAVTGVESRMISTELKAMAASASID